MAGTSVCGWAKQMSFAGKADVGKSRPLGYRPDCVTGASADCGRAVTRRKYARVIAVQPKSWDQTLDQAEETS